MLLRHFVVSTSSPLRRPSSCPMGPYSCGSSPPRPVPPSPCRSRCLPLVVLHWVPPILCFHKVFFPAPVRPVYGSSLDPFSGGSSPSTHPSRTPFSLEVPKRLKSLHRPFRSTVPWYGQRLESQCRKVSHPSLLFPVLGGPENGPGPLAHGG